MLEEVINRKEFDFLLLRSTRKSLNRFILFRLFVLFDCRSMQFTANFSIRKPILLYSYFIEQLQIDNNCLLSKFFLNAICTVSFDLNILKLFVWRGI